MREKTYPYDRASTEAFWLEEKYLYDWAGAEAYWVEEDSSVSGDISNVPELYYWHEDEQALTVELSIAVERINLGVASEQPAQVSAPGPEKRRNWLYAGAIGGVAVLAAIGSVRVFSGSGDQKKASMAKAGQPVHPATPTDIAPGTLQVILPPADPRANIAASPDFLADCQDDRYDDSTKCVRATLKAIDNARAQEGLRAMRLPSYWYALNPAEQLFFATNMERSVRGLETFTAVNSALDQAAAQAANKSTDPSLPNGFPPSNWTSNWAGAVGNSLEAIYYWMYDDGLGSNNVYCTATDTDGCWGHRNNVLMNVSGQTRLMGVAVAPTAYNGDPSFAEILVDSSGQ